MRLSRAPAPIGVGQRYRQTIGGSGVWVVVGFATDHAGNPHARMTSEGDGTRMVTIALAALRDPKLYRRARADPGRIVVGGYASGLDEVRRFVGDDPRIKYCEGTFPDTSHMVPEGVRFALVHLDCDLYVPTKAALEFFYPRLEPGGLLILHDYDSGCWPGIPRAVDEFLADKPEGLIRIPDKSGTAALVKQLDTPGQELKRINGGTQETA